MKTILISAVALWCSIYSFEATAQDRLRLDVDITFLSKFIWRGATWTDDPVFWPQATLRYKDARCWLFFNVDLTDINNDKFECNEFDFIVDYTFKIKSFGIAPGILHFSSPTNFFKPSTKITLALKTETLLNPSLNFRFDVKGIKGSYVILKTNQNVPMGIRGKTFDTSVWISAGSAKYYGVDKGVVLTDALLRISVPFQIRENITISPAVEFTALIDRNIRAAYDDNQNIVFAITMSSSIK